MSWFSKLVRGGGKLLKKAAPFVGMIPGIGTIGAAALGGLGGLASGTSIGKGAAGGALGGLAGGALRGLGGIAGKALGGEGGGLLSNILGGAGNLLGSAGKALGINSPQDLLQAAMTGYAGYQGLKAGGAAEKGMTQSLEDQRALAKRMQEIAEERYAQGAPVRGEALGRIQERISAGPRATPDTSRFADTLNPFRARFGGMPGAGPPPGISAVGGGPPPMPPMLPPPPGVGGPGAVPPPGGMKGAIGSLLAETGGAPPPGGGPGGMKGSLQSMISRTGAGPPPGGGPGGKLSMIAALKNAMPPAPPTGGGPGGMKGALLAQLQSKVAKKRKPSGAVGRQSPGGTGGLVRTARGALR